MKILFEQGDTTIEAEPLSYGESIEDFYGHRKYGHPHSHTPTDIERGNVSELFFYRDPDGSLSLVIIHDDKYDSYGGDVTFQFTGLPDDGSWAVRDDDPGNDTYFGENKVEWHWGSTHTDGAAYRADFDESTSVTIDPSFYNGIDEWQVLSGDAENPTRRELNKSEPVTISFGEAAEVLSTSATAVTLLPGHSEDSQGGGDDLDSAMPDYWGKSLDAWFIADQVTDLPDDLEEVEAMSRHLPEYDEGLKQYRLKNQIEIELPTADRQTIEDWSNVQVRTNDDEEPPYVAVEGQPGEDNAIRDIIDDDLDWFDGKDKLRADVEDKRFESGPVKEVIDGVEGVRASVIFGGGDTYITIMKEKVTELGPREFLDRAGLDLDVVPAFIMRPPTMYTFLELVLMSDGTKLAKVWDSSRYPKHYLYAESRKRAETEFEEDEGLTDIGQWEKNEDMNLRFTQWVFEEQDVRSPFYPHTHGGYEKYFDFPTAYGPHPVMTFGEDGSELTQSQVEAELDTLFPW